MFCDFKSWNTRSSIRRIMWSHTATSLATHCAQAHNKHKFTCWNKEALANHMHCLAHSRRCNGALVSSLLSLCHKWRHEHKLPIIVGSHLGESGQFIKFTYKEFAHLSSLWFGTKGRNMQRKIARKFCRGSLTSKNCQSLPGKFAWQNTRWFKLSVALH